MQLLHRERFDGLPFGPPACDLLIEFIRPSTEGDAETAAIEVAVVDPGLLAQPGGPFRPQTVTQSAEPGFGRCRRFEIAGGRIPAPAQEAPVRIVPVRGRGLWFRVRRVRTRSTSRSRRRR